MTTPGRWDEAKRLFDAALTLEASARDEYLLTACHGDAELLAEVRSLLLWHDDESFLEAPAARVAEFSLMAATAADMIGRSLGTWRIHRAASQRDPGNTRAKCDAQRLSQSLAEASAGRRTLSPAPCTP